MRPMAAAGASVVDPTVIECIAFGMSAHGGRPAPASPRVTARGRPPRSIGGRQCVASYTPRDPDTTTYCLRMQSE
jgi:hypothetical protein